MVCTKDGERHTTTGRHHHRMFTVTGTINSVGYRVGIHPTSLPDEPDALGCVMGSDNALSLLRMSQGQEAAATPTSSPVTLDVNDPASVLAFLYSATQVNAVDGDDIPKVLGEDEAEPGAVH